MKGKNTGQKTPAKVRFLELKFAEQEMFTQVFFFSSGKKASSVIYPVMELAFAFFSVIQSLKRIIINLRLSVQLVFLPA